MTAGQSLQVRRILTGASIFAEVNETGSRWNQVGMVVTVGQEVILEESFMVQVPESLKGDEVILEIAHFVLTGVSILLRRATTLALLNSCSYRFLCHHTSGWKSSTLHSLWFSSSRFEFTGQRTLCVPLDS